MLVDKNKNVISHRRLSGNIKNNKISATSIAGKIQGAFYLKKFCEKKFADNLAVVKNIRETLVGYRLLTIEEAQYVQPRHYLIFSPNQYQLRIIKGSQVAFSP